MAKHRVPPIARIRLARSLPRLLAWPAVVIGTGIMAGASWWFGSFGSGLGGIVFAALGALLVLVGLVVALLLLSVRLQVHEAAIHLTWLGGQRIYVLTRGPVTRVRLRGDDASSLRPRFGMFGWAIGAARLREEEEIQVVRLARTRTAILVPTEQGRLAIAAADEDALLDALSRAARARQRLEDLTDVASRTIEVRAPALPAPSDSPHGARLEAPPEPEAPAEPEPEPEPEPVFLTGIERALLEQRLAEERAAAEAAAAADAERVPDDVGPLPGATVGDGVPASVSRDAEADAGRPLGRRPSLAFVLLPLLAAGAAWAAGLTLGTYPDPQSDVGRLTTLALVLAGPATAVGAIMARTWWPRLVGVVVTGGLVASAFIGRALIG